MEAVPVADIESKTIEYIYSNRITLDTLPEDCGFPYVNFTDQSAAVDVTLDNAIDNQGATPATQTTDIFVRIDDNSSWAFQDSGGTADILRVDALAAGDEVEINGDLDVNNTNTADFAQGVSVDTADTAINLGVTAGQIDAAASLTVSATGGSSNLTLSSGLETIFVDGNKSGSTFTGDLKLAETTAEWDAYEVAFGEVSLLNAITQAKNDAGGTRVDYVVTTLRNADDNFNPATHATTINGSIPDLTGLDFTTTDVTVYVNGQLMIGGADAAANNDFYPGTTLTAGDLKFEFKIKVNDTITVLT